MLEAVGAVEGLGGADPLEALARQADLDSRRALLAGELAEGLDQLVADRPAAPLGMDPEVLDRAVATRNVDRVLPAGGEDPDDAVLAPCLRHQQGTHPPVPGKLPRRLLELGGRRPATAQLDQQLARPPRRPPARRCLGRLAPAPGSASAPPPHAASALARAGSSSTLQASAESLPVTVRAIAAIGARALSRISSNSSCGVGLHDDRPAGADRRPARPQDDRADHDAEVHHAVEAEVADRPRVDAARLGLEVVDDLHRALLRRAGHRAAGEAGAGALDGAATGAGSRPSTVEISWCTVA